MSSLFGGSKVKCLGQFLDVLVLLMTGAARLQALFNIGTAFCDCKGLLCNRPLRPQHLGVPTVLTNSSIVRGVSLLFGERLAYARSAARNSGRSRMGPRFSVLQRLSMITG